MFIYEKHIFVLYIFHQYNPVSKSLRCIITWFLPSRSYRCRAPRYRRHASSYRRHPIKDRAHLSTFKIFIFEKFSCFIVLVVFFGYCPIIRIGFCVILWKKMTFFPNFFSYHIFAIYVGGASLGLPTACRLIAVSGARLPSVDGLVVRCIKMHHHVKSAITVCLQFI